MWRSSCDAARRALAAAAGLALAVALAGCGALTVPQERQLGERVAREMQGELLLVRDEVILEYVTSIGEKILLASGPQPFVYRFYVVEDGDINASAAPGGHIFVHTGTILAAANVSELAGVIAHEVGHVARRHIAQNYSRTRNTSIVYNLGVLAASFFGWGGVAQLGGGLAAMAVVNSFGREAEREADAFAVLVLPPAGYDPEGLVTFFETVRAEGGPEPPPFLSSHPATADRIAETRALIAAQPVAPGLLRDDRGRLEIIQQRIRLLTGQTDPTPGAESEFEPL